MASEFKKKKSGRKAVRIVLIVVAVLAVGAAVFGVLKIRQSRQAQSAVDVQTAVVERGTITEAIDGSGNLEAAEVQGVLVPIGVTIDKVQVQAGDTVKKGDVLATVNTASVAGAIADVDDSLTAVKNSLNASGVSSYEREELTARRDELQAIRDELVTLHDNPVITATADGVIGSVGVSDGSEITAGTSASSAISAGSDTAVSGTGMAFTANGEPLVAISLAYASEEPVADGGEEPAATSITAEELAKIMDQIQTPKTGDEAAEVQINKDDDRAMFYGQLTWVTADETFLPDTTYTAVVQLTANDGYYFTMDPLLTLKQNLAEKNIMLDYVEETTILPAGTLEFTLTFPETGEDGDDTPDQGDDSSSDDISTDTADYSSILSSLFGSSSYYSSGTDYTGVSSVTGETYTDTYNANEAEAFTIVLMDNVKLKINVDELDVLQVKEGQTAVVTIDAVDGAEYEGTIERVSSTATGSTGSAKYVAEIVIPMDDSMRIGMSASATIVTGEAADVLTLPMVALQESDGETFVYTAVDESTGLPGSPVTVTVGMADGTTAEITSGLNEGDIAYYTRSMTDDIDLYY